MPTRKQKQIIDTLRFKKDSIQSKVFAVLKDKQWHCRGHEYSDVGSGQLAGGGGIQGLERGTRLRPGLVIESRDAFCDECQRMVRWDRWSGEYRLPNAPSFIPETLQLRILQHYNYTDAMERRRRPPHELVIDHRFPMIRWGGLETKLDVNMSDSDIEARFQLLKKDAGGNHNLLKSRACEKCFKTERRGRPFGIDFFYQGNEEWPSDIPKEGKDAEEGCHGCGWYNLEMWREELNKHLKRTA